MLYKLLTFPQLCLFDSEKVLGNRLKLLKLFHSLPLGRQLLRARYCALPSKYLKTEALGMTFRNPVGLAAGIDVNGKYTREFGALGFGFVEIGSVTPEPHEKPKNADKSGRRRRIVFLPKDKAFLDCAELYNDGAVALTKELHHRNPGVIVAGNISKNPTASKEEAIADFERAFALIYDFVDMIVVNASCPSDRSLNDLQDITYLSEILDSLLELRHLYDDYKPIAVKLSTDIPKSQLNFILDFILRRGVDAVVATNSVIRKEMLQTPARKLEKYRQYSLSGAPLFDKMLYMVSYIRERTSGTLPVIAAGGIDTPQKAVQVLRAGASLVELCSGLAIEGPSLTRKVLRAVRNYRKKTAAQ